MSKTINVLIVLDTDLVKAQNPPKRDQDQNQPTDIGHNFGYMVASGTTTIGSSQGTGMLNFNAIDGDTVRAFAVSGSDNFEDSVLLYGMQRFDGDTVMSPFNYINFPDKSTIVPKKATDPLPGPGTIAAESFWFFQGTVVTNRGTEQYRVQFALYDRDVKGAPQLYGYFQWDPTITVG